MELKALMEENRGLKERLDQKINQNKILSAELKEVFKHFRYTKKLIYRERLEEKIPYLLSTFKNLTIGRFFLACASLECEGS